MNYSDEVKNYLSRITLDQQSLIESELYAMLQSGIVFLMKGRGKIHLKFQTTHAALARLFYTLIKKVMSYHAEVKRVEHNQFGQNHSYVVEIDDSTICLEILNYFSLADVRSVLIRNNAIESAFLQTEDERRAYLRGVFLACGYIADPTKNFLVEFRMINQEYAKNFFELLSTFEIQAHQREKKDEIILYLKRSQDISNLLAQMGAFEYMLNYEDRVAMKEMKNKLQRTVNCDTANLNKTIESSIIQQKAIEKIMKLKGLSYLPEHLIQAAQLRLDYPESSLKEMAEIASPTISRSTLNKRLKRIVEIAEQLSH